MYREEVAEAGSRSIYEVVRRKLMKLRKSQTLVIVAAVVMVVSIIAVLSIHGYFGLPEGDEEEFIKAQTFDSINELQESPSEETIKKLKILIESPLLDSYLRERAIFVLTDVSIKLEKDTETRDYLKEIALNQEMPANLHSAAFANIYLIDELFPPEKHGVMQVDVQGEIKPGARISIIVKLLSEIDVENAQVGAGVIINSEVVDDPIITVITRPPYWKGSLQANTLKELEFEFQIEKEGEIELPVAYKFSFDAIDYEIEKQSLYFKITESGGEFSRTPIFE